MAALNRPTNATYETHENVTIDTQDNEDHTFWWVKEWYRIVSYRITETLHVTRFMTWRYTVFKKRFFFLIENLLHPCLMMDVVQNTNFLFVLFRFVFLV